MPQSGDSGKDLQHARASARQETLLPGWSVSPAPEGDECPDALNHSKGPGSSEPPIEGGGSTGERKDQHPPRGARFQGVGDEHHSHSASPKDRECIHGFSYRAQERWLSNQSRVATQVAARSGKGDRKNSQEGYVKPKSEDALVFPDWDQQHRRGPARQNEARTRCTWPVRSRRQLFRHLAPLTPAVLAGILFIVK